MLLANYNGEHDGSEIIGGIKGCKENVEETSHVKRKANFMVTCLGKKKNYNSLIRSGNRLSSNVF